MRKGCTGALPFWAWSCLYGRIHLAVRHERSGLEMSFSRFHSSHILLAQESRSDLVTFTHFIPIPLCLPRVSQNEQITAVAYYTNTDNDPLNRKKTELNFRQPWAQPTNQTIRKQKE